MCSSDLAIGANARSQSARWFARSRLTLRVIAIGTMLRTILANDFDGRSQRTILAIEALDDFSIFVAELFLSLTLSLSFAHEMKRFEGKMNL